VGVENVAVQYSSCIAALGVVKHQYGAYLPVKGASFAVFATKNAVIGIETELNPLCRLPLPESP
jgi:hypothetical protein